LVQVGEVVEDEVVVLRPVEAGEELVAVPFLMDILMLPPYLPL
jgi:hypothetical protein